MLLGGGMSSSEREVGSCCSCLNLECSGGHFPQPPPAACPTLASLGWVVGTGSLGDAAGGSTLQGLDFCQVHSVALILRGT